MDLSHLGDRGYLDSMHGGSFWGEAPGGQHYTANGGLANNSWWENFDNTVMTPKGFAMGIGGAALAPALMGAAGASGGAAAASSPWMTAAKYLAPSLISGMFSRGGGGAMTTADQWPGSTSGGYGSPSPLMASGGGMFNDPTTQPLMAAWQQRMSQLQQPAPNYGDINGVLSGFLKPDPRFDSAIASMQQIGKSSAPSNAYTGQYASAVTNRMKELNAQPFSTSDEAALKARFFDSLALNRDKAYDEVAQQASSRGFAPTSGVAAGMNAQVGADYQKARAGQQQAMLQYVTDERNRRRDEAVSMSGGLQQAGAGDAQLQAQWLSQRANIIGNIASALMAQRNSSMSAAESMASLRRQQYMDDMGRGDAMLTTSAIPSQLADQRMSQLQSVLSGGSDPSQIFSQLLAMQQMNNQNQQQSNASKAGLWSAIGQIAGPALGAMMTRH